jgi:hypothetical protein
MRYGLYAGIMLLCVSGASHAAVLYGLQDGFGTPGNLYTISKVTGIATFAAHVSGGDPSFVGLEYAHSSLYATDILSAAGTFGTLDSSTGAYTGITEPNASINVHGLAFVPSTNLFYTVDLDGGEVLLSIAANGTTNVIGQAARITGLAYGNGVLYGAGSVSGVATLFNIDITTGASTAIGALGLVGDSFGLAYDADDDTLYLNGLDSLYSVNTATGAASLIGANGVEGINGLAAAPLEAVPEPGTMAVAGAALGALAARRKFRPAI